MEFRQDYTKSAHLGPRHGPISLCLVLLILTQNPVGTTITIEETTPSFYSSTSEPLPNSSSNSDTEIPDISTTSLPPTTTDSEEERRRQKYLGTPRDIILEHTDFVTLRLRHLLAQTSSNISDLRILQQTEFNRSSLYLDAWTYATKVYNETKKSLITATFANSSLILGAPPELHIALIAYTGNFYYEFNAKTRELCSGFDIDNYEYKSFFKMLELAIEVMGREISRYSTSANGSTSYEEKVLYRGVNKIFALKIGQRLAFQHFISTSRNPDVATGFSGATVFEIHAERGQPLGNGVYLGFHSIFTSEEEVLLSPLEVFEVERIDTERESGMVHVILKISALSANLLPTPEKECPWNLKSVEEMKDYVGRLKLAVAVMGAVLVTLLLAGGTLSLYAIFTRRKFCYKARTVSELALT